MKHEPAKRCPSLTGHTSTQPSLKPIMRLAIRMISDSKSSVDRRFSSFDSLNSTYHSFTVLDHQTETVD